MKQFLAQATLLFNQCCWQLRLLLIALIAILIFLFCLLCGFEPLAHQIHLISLKTQQIKNNVSVLELSDEDYESIGQTPRSLTEKKIELLNTQLLKLQGQPLLAKKIVLSSADLQKFLQAISKPDFMLSFDNVKKLEAVHDIHHQAGPVFRQNILIEFQGSYFNTLHYLSYLESLPWYMSFDSFEYEVTQYPNAKIDLKLSVLSTGEAHG